MSHLRWNPLLGTWTIVAANRQLRPDMPRDWCPFCPAFGKVPSDFDVLVYPNDFPVFSPEEADLLPVISREGPYKAARAYGSAEVLLYSPDHNARLYNLPEAHLLRLVQLWSERQTHYSRDEKIKYIYPFESRGAEVGVTMPHPHGQLYAFPYVPLKIITELEQSRAHFQAKGSNLFDDMLAEESKGDRVLLETEHFLVFLPFFTDYPYGFFIVSKDPVIYISELEHDAKKELGDLLKKVLGTFDTLFDKVFPYMMCIHQSPVNSPEWGDTRKYYRFHIEFYPPLRSENAIKYYASSEMGAWAAANTMEVEQSILHLRDALKRFESR